MLRDIILLMCGGALFLIIEIFIYTYKNKYKDYSIHKDTPYQSALRIAMANKTITKTD